MKACRRCSAAQPSRGRRGGRAIWRLCTALSHRYKAIVDLLALLEDLKTKSLILGAKQDLAVLVDLLNTGEDAEEVIVDWLRAGCKRCLILLG